MMWRTVLLAALSSVVLGMSAHATEDIEDFTPTEITQVSVGPDGSITLNGKASTLGAFKTECKRLRRVNGGLEYVPHPDGHERRTVRRIAQIVIATGVSFRFVGSDGAVPQEFKAAVPKVPL
jgi:hypothetical protein